jgi:hypothetical protein
MLNTLNASVHHEMIAPITANVDISKRMIKIFSANGIHNDLREMA